MTDIGCDYLTATARERSSAEKLHAVGSSLFRTQREFGNNSKPWGMAGFTGYKCGSVQVATLGGAVMVRLSSDSAARSWRRVVDHAENVSRIDLQVTMQFGGDLKRIIDKCRKAARRNSEESGNHKRVRWVQEHHGGYTLYLGDRQSNVFGRIYDKWEESKLDHYKGCIRFEAQYQKKLAWFVARELWSMSSPIPGMGSYLSQLFLGRAVDLKLAGSIAARYSCPRQRTDDEKQLEWLSTQCRPSVLRLISNGKGDEVLRALGLITDGPTISTGDVEPTSTKEKWG